MCVLHNFKLETTKIYKRLKMFSFPVLHHHIPNLKLVSCGKSLPRIIVLAIVSTLLVFYPVIKISFHGNESSVNIKVIFKPGSYDTSKFISRSNYTILANYVRAKQTFKLEESVTYVAHGEYPYLDNLMTIVGRWAGPVSISVFTPGSDFIEALRRIHYLRNCVKKPGILERVTFHIYFPKSHPPAQELLSETTWYSDMRCSEQQNLKFGPELMVNTYRKNNSLMYPINLGRNLAQEQATTKYVLGSDLELYPSPRDLIPKFLRFVKRYEETAENQPTAYVLPTFEVNSTVPITPSTKSDLQDLFSMKLADFFHRHICWYCHFPPEHNKWIEQPENHSNVGMFVKMKRESFRWSFWEPFSITLKNTPPYDERLMKEMFMDRLPREYIFCLLNYDYVVLDNAFLVHKPGIRADNSHKDLKVNMKLYSTLKHTYTDEYLETYGNGKKSSCGLR